MRGRMQVIICPAGLFEEAVRFWLTSSSRRQLELRSPETERIALEATAHEKPTDLIILLRSVLLFRSFRTEKAPQPKTPSGHHLHQRTAAIQHLQKHFMKKYLYS